MKIYSNIVPEHKVREVQQETLGIIADALCKSFGPKGSSTAFVKNIDQNGVNIAVDHTKDGHTIVKNIQFLHPIERSVQDLLTELTRYVVKEVGDGTTSAIILCKTVFDCLCNNKMVANNPPADTIRRFHNAVAEVSKRIMEKKRECTLEDIYKIALISTNNNEDVSATLMQVYKQFGMDVYIDVGISNEVDNIVKEYDGMTLDTGFTDMCFVNDKANNKAAIRNPKIYCFNDPIDTPEMLSMLDVILDTNILRCYRPNSPYEPVPTVIFCKAISPDTSSYFETVVKLMNSGVFVPLLIVSDIHQEYLYEDIAKMCGAPFIKKYINPELQQKDIEAGLAPTEETIINFCGTADLVESDQVKTKVVRPAKMFNEAGEYSEEYLSMLSYLETQVDKAKNENEGIDVISEAKRRLNCFKGNMVDYLIGGMTLSDRNNLKASVEDAVLNCRSAAINGVGYGANYMAFLTLNEMIHEAPYSSDVFVRILFDAYKELIEILYGKSYTKKEIEEDIIPTSISKGCPLNIRTNEYDGNVLSSIKSDVIILETIDKILTLMFTCNQYLVQTPAHNIYIADE